MCYSEYRSTKYFAAHLKFKVLLRDYCTNKATREQTQDTKWLSGILSSSVSKVRDEDIKVIQGHQESFYGETGSE